MRNLELIRAYVERTLTAPERAAFEERLAREPELARMVEAYDLTVRATVDVAPARGVEFHDLRLPARGWTPARWAVAATLLVAVGVAVALVGREGAHEGGGGRVPEPPGRPPAVLLAAVPREPVAAPAVPDRPEDLSTYETADANGLRWLGDDTAAMDLARFVDRPMLVFVHHSMCPICRGYRARQFREAEVAAAAEDFVLLEANVEQLPAWVYRELPKESFPIFLVSDPDDGRLSYLTGSKTAAELTRWLGGVASELKAEKRYAFPAWRMLRAALRKLDRAQQSADPAERLELWREVEAEAEDTRLAEIARAERLGMEASAQAALDRARAADTDSAVKILDEAGERLRGTPYADDLAKVAAHIRTHGAFPELE